MKPTENESWLIEYGDTVVERKAKAGKDALSSIDQLVYFLWVADYGMRNAGDLSPSFDLDGTFHLRGAVLARKLGLTESHGLFGLPPQEFQREYFNRFERVCEELKSELS